MIPKCWQDYKVGRTNFVESTSEIKSGWYDFRFAQGPIFRQLCWDIKVPPCYSPPSSNSTWSFEMMYCMSFYLQGHENYYGSNLNVYFLLKFP